MAMFFIRKLFTGISVVEERIKPLSLLKNEPFVYQTGMLPPSLRLHGIPVTITKQVWCPSAHTHRRDTALNNSLRLVSGCIWSTQTFMLLVVSQIIPPDIRRNKQCLPLSRRAEANDQHALLNIVTASTPGTICMTHL